MLPATLIPMLSDAFPVSHPRALPEELELTVNPLFNRFAIQLTELEPVLADTVMEGHVDIRKNGVWHSGTELYRC